MATDSGNHQTTSTSTQRALTRAAVQARQFICGLHGHDSLLHFEQGRMSLLCASCGYESPGWDVKGKHSNDEASPRSPRGVQMPLVGHRRIA